MKKPLLVSFSLLLVFLVACQSESHRLRNAPDDTDGVQPTQQKINNEHYELRMPKGWKRINKTVYGRTYLFLQAPGSNSDTNTIIYVTSNDMHNVNLDTYFSQILQEANIPSLGVTLVDRGDIEANGIIGKWYSYTYRKKATQRFV